jgi:hypothetical protein
MFVCTIPGKTKSPPLFRLGWKRVPSKVSPVLPSRDRGHFGNQDGRHLPAAVIVAVHSLVHPDGVGERIEAEAEGGVSQGVDGVGAEGAVAAEGAAARGQLAGADDLGQASIAPEEDAFTTRGHVGGEDQLAIVVEPAGLEVVGEFAPFRPRGGLAERGHRREAEAGAQQRAGLE